MKEKMAELQIAFAALDNKYKEIKASDMGETNKDEMMMDFMSMMMDFMSMMRNVSSRLDYVSNAVWDYQYTHGKGHLPPIKTASQMEKALKMCGMDDDYQVEKPCLYMSASVSARKGVEVVASYEKKV